MIFALQANLKYRCGNQKFWCTGYYVDTVERNKKGIEEYIRNLIQNDIVVEQLSMMDYIDPFTSEEVKIKKLNRLRPLMSGSVEVVQLAKYSVALLGLVSNECF